MDNIDADYARKKIKVINTPAASSVSVAELVFAHLFGMVRFLLILIDKCLLETLNLKLKKSFSKVKNSGKH